MKRWMHTATRLLCVIAIPYLIGILVSDKIVPSNFFSAERNNTINNQNLVNTINSESNANNDDIHEDGNMSLDTQISDNPLEGVTISVHRNGEATRCGKESLSGVGFYNAFQTVGKQKYKKSKYSKYQFDSIVTTTLGLHVIPEDECGPELPPPEIKGKKNRMNWGRGLNYSITGASPFLSFCDMGEERTPILLDHHKLEPVFFGKGRSENSLPCHYYTREGLRVASIKQLVDITRKIKQKTSLQVEGVKNCANAEDGRQVCKETLVELKLFAVPAGRVFMFSPAYVGEVFELDHVQDKFNRVSRIVTISLSPRVFDILNFFDKDEADTIVQRAMAEKSDTHRLKRSSTGASGYNVNSQRTSENGFDTSGETAINVKRRCMYTLGFDEYQESYTDGLQVLRYNISTAYIPHMDWIDDPGHREEHDYFSELQGTNRFATVLLYMSNLEEKGGGETVFTKAWPPNLPEEERVPKSESLRLVRESGEVSFLKKGSWEENMVADCRTRLAVRPHAARAILFYSQHPNGEQDFNSKHGACPVISGQKWAANLWVWNGPRAGYPKSPKNKYLTKKEPTKEKGMIQGIFSNTRKNPTFAKADLYYEDMFWGELSHGSQPLSVNTFEGHIWNVKRKSDKKVLRQWVIGKDNGETMKFTV